MLIIAHCRGIALIVNLNKNLREIKLRLNKELKTARLGEFA